MKKLILPLIVLLVFTACKKQEVSPQYVEKVLYAGDSVRYNLDSLPVNLPVAPLEYSQYYKLIQVFTNNTVIADYTHLLSNGVSVTYRGFIRYDKNNNYYDLKGWYRRRKVTGYIIPANKAIVIYRTIPYNFMPSDTTE